MVLCLVFSSSATCYLLQGEEPQQPGLLVLGLVCHVPGTPATQSCTLIDASKRVEVMKKGGTAGRRTALNSGLVFFAGRHCPKRSLSTHDVQERSTRAGWENVTSSALVRSSSMSSMLGTAI
jgi:hypothetical protein